MKITRQRLKNIIMEEIALQEASPDLTQMTTAPGEGTGQTAYVGNAPANAKAMAELGEGVEMITPENIQLVLDVATQMGLNFGPAFTAALMGKSFVDAVKFVLGKKKNAAEETETVQEEAEEGTLEELITQAIQEELTQMASKK